MILHIDMDAFFASVEQLDNPWLRGRCVVVGGTSNRGVVSAASYEARRFGVHSAMPVFQARRVCPEAVFLPPRMSRYKTVSRQIMAILRQVTPLVEPVSIDEAFLDVGGCRRLFGPPEALAAELKRRVCRCTGLTCSVGVAPNRFLAKIASDLEKPDGLTIVTARQVPEFVAGLDIGKVPGIGRTGQRRLALIGVRRLGDVPRLPVDLLTRRLGKFAHRLIQLAHGIDPTPVQPHTSVKSMSTERTLARDTDDGAVLRHFLLQQTQEVARQLRKAGMRARTVTLKIKTADFKQVTRRTTLKRPTQSSEDLFRTAAGLLAQVPLSPKVRLIGVGAAGLVGPGQLLQAGLFDAPETRSPVRWEKVEHTLDRIADRFGCEVVQRASLKGGGPGKAANPASAPPPEPHGPASPPQGSGPSGRAIKPGPGSRHVKSAR